MRPVYKRVDSCAAEFASHTAYMYSTYDEECEAEPTERDKIMILGGGPNRIGQGIEFDYCCVHAALALREDGFETIMVNCNPETVSTDYDTSDRLYFEPLTSRTCWRSSTSRSPKGVIVQFGGQTPLKLARDLEAAGVPIIGTSPGFDRPRRGPRALPAADRGARPAAAAQPHRRSVEEALALAERDRLPAGGAAVLRARRPRHGDRLRRRRPARYMREAVKVSNDSPVLLDRFLDDAVEVDVDAICDGERRADRRHHGAHRAGRRAFRRFGLLAAAAAATRLSAEMQERLREQVVEMARALNVVGLMNTQFAIQGDDIYLLEVNPRASRTVPFVSKATGVPLAKIAARCMVGQVAGGAGLHRAGRARTTLRSRSRCSRSSSSRASTRSSVRR